MKSCNTLISILSVLASATLVQPFAPVLGHQHARSVRAMFMATEETATSVDSVTDSLTIPVTFDEMVRMASSAMTDAQEQGLNRQMMRVLLPRDPQNEQLGVFFENDADVDTQNLVLFPIDESWQGGIMQLYRAAQPTVEAILRRYSRKDSGVPPRIQEDRSVDESGVDGVSLFVTQSTSPQDDVSCFLQPTQETIDAVERISGQAGNRLVLLVNPQWRFVDDALDAASKGGGIIGNFASFLGGKGNSLKRLDAMNFEYVFVLEGYVCRGGNIRMIKRFDSDWAVFAENDSATDYIKVGTSKSRPTYQEIDQMLQDMGVSLKYARDIGLAPKL